MGTGAGDKPVGKCSFARYSVKFPHAPVIMVYTLIINYNRSPGTQGKGSRVGGYVTGGRRGATTYLASAPPPPEGILMGRGTGDEPREGRICREQP